MRLILQELSK